MIPFDVDPMGYYLSMFVFGLVALTIFAGFVFKSDWEKFITLSAISTALLILVMLLFIVWGNVYTDTITICAHDRGTVIDTNENIYYINDQITKFKVKDNETVKVKIKKYDWNMNKIIYSIDAPITCGNQTCGVTS